MRILEGYKWTLKDNLKWVRTREAEFVSQPYLVGYAYRDFNREATVYYIVPLNIVIALARWLWWRLAWIWPDVLIKPYRRIYELGKKDGYEKGRFSRDVVRGAMDILRGEGHDVTSRNDPGV